jgi:hypothetical protein
MAKRADHRLEAILASEQAASWRQHLSPCFSDDQARDRLLHEIRDGVAASADEATFRETSSPGAASSLWPSNLARPQSTTRVSP